MLGMMLIKEATILVNCLKMEAEVLVVSSVDQLSCFTESKHACSLVSCTWL